MSGTRLACQREARELLVVDVDARERDESVCLEAPDKTIELLRVGGRCSAPPPPIHGEHAGLGADITDAGVAARELR